MQREKLTIKIEHSHLEIAKVNRAKWLGQAEKNIAIKLQSIKKKRKRDTISIHTLSLSCFSVRLLGHVTAFKKPTALPHASWGNGSRKIETSTGR